MSNTTLSIPAKILVCSACPTWVKCDGQNCMKNLPFLARAWNKTLKSEAREDGYVSIGEIRSLENKIERLSRVMENLDGDAHYNAVVEMESLEYELESSKLGVSMAYSTMPNWVSVAPLRPMDLTDIPRQALEVAEDFMAAFETRCKTLRTERHENQTKQVELAKAGLASEFGPAGSNDFRRYPKGEHPWAIAWAKTTAVKAVYTERAKAAKAANWPIKSAIFVLDMKEQREYEDGYTVVKGASEDGAYRFSDIPQALGYGDLKDMMRKDKGLKPTGIDSSQFLAKQRFDDMTALFIGGMKSRRSVNVGHVPY